MPVPDYFLSYSELDGGDFAECLYNHLVVAGKRTRGFWFARRQLPGQSAGRCWGPEIEQGIDSANAILFVATTDSVTPESWCQKECDRAMRRGKPIILLWLHRVADVPLSMEGLQTVDFSRAYDPVTKSFDPDEFEASFSELQLFFFNFESAKGVLDFQVQQRRKLEHDLSRADDPALHDRVEQDLRAVDARIERQKGVLANPERAKHDAQARIEASMAIQRLGDFSSVPTPVRAGLICPFHPPVEPASLFLDRELHRKELADFLLDDGRRMLMVVGRGGLGKTALVLHVLDQLEKGEIAREGEEQLRVAGIVYLSELGIHRISVPQLFAGIKACLTPAMGQQVDGILSDTTSNTQMRVWKVLEVVGDNRIIVLMDNFESVLDRNDPAFECKDTELKEALTALLKAPRHWVKIILTTQFVPKDLALIEPRRQARPIEIEEGLPSPFAEKFLRSEDTAGHLQLRDAPEELLKQVQVRTGGNPHALTILVGLLGANRSLSLEQILSDTKDGLPIEMSDILVGYLYKELGPISRQTVQALAIFEDGVSPVAIDYVLEPFVPGIQSSPVLDQLCDMRAVQLAPGGGRRFSLHSIDRAYFLRQVPETAPTGAGMLEFTLTALKRRAADYFRNIRVAAVNRKSVADLDPELREFRLRTELGEYDEAARILLAIGAHLDLWGLNRTVSRLHEQLHGHLTDPHLQVQSTNHLAGAYLAVGKYVDAEALANAGRDLAVQLKDAVSETMATSVLATCHYHQGYYDQAIAMGRACLDLRVSDACPEIRRVLIQVNHIVGCSYSLVGETASAVKFVQIAEGLAWELGDQRAHCFEYATLGLFASYLGKGEEALRYDQKALKIAGALGAKREQSRIAGYLAEACFQRGEYNESIGYARQSLKIEGEISATVMGSWSNQWLAAALFYSTGNASLAREAAVAGCSFDEPINNHNLESYRGVFLLLEGNRTAAREAFLKTVTEAGKFIGRCSSNWEAHDAMGLALTGLAIIDGNDYLDRAISAFISARAITRDAGTVRRAILQVEMLKAVAPTDVLARARDAASGIQTTESRH